MESLDGVSTTRLLLLGGDVEILSAKSRGYLGLQWPTITFWNVGSVNGSSSGLRRRRLTIFILLVTLLIALLVLIYRSSKTICGRDMNVRPAGSVSGGDVGPGGQQGSKFTKYCSRYNESAPGSEQLVELNDELYERMMMLGDGDAKHRYDHAIDYFIN